MSNQINKFREEIANPTDGPITDFVLISRAVRIAANSANSDEEAIANALYEELLSRGFLLYGRVRMD